MSWVSCNVKILRKSTLRSLVKNEWVVVRPKRNNFSRKVVRIFPVKIKDEESYHIEFY